MKIGDRVRTLIPVNAQAGEEYLALPAGIPGTIEERDDDNMFIFIGWSEGKKFTTYISANEIEPLYQDEQPNNQ